MKIAFASLALVSILAVSLVAHSAPRASERLPAQAAPPSANQSSAPRSPAAPTAKSNGVGAVVITDEAYVYAQPDFDATILTSAHKGDRVRVSRGTAGAYAKFHRVRVGAVLGYISTMDVEVEGGASVSEPRVKARSALARRTKSGSKRGAKSGAKSAGKNANETKRPKREQLPIYFTRYVGVLVGNSEFKEDTAGGAQSTRLLTYGLKVTGPDTLLQGPVTDFNLALHYGAPSYYDSFSATSPTGFVLFADFLLLIPYLQRENFVGYFGAGPLLTLSSFKVTRGDEPLDLTTLNAGVSVSTGLGVRFDKVALRLEGKYLFEKKNYLAFQAALQTEF
jgi:hypothetical protein